MRIWILLFVGLFSLVLGAVTMSGQAPQAPEVVAQSAPVVGADIERKWVPLDPRKVEGQAKCVDCHKSEVKAWLASTHANKTFTMLRTNKNAKKYAQALDYASPLAPGGECVKCHATRRIDEHGKRRVLQGVSCEACHNAAGGDPGWLNQHAVYGPAGTPRNAETYSHYLKRIAFCDKTHQYRSDTLYLLARSCFECHLVNNELVAVKTDHPDGNSSNFELVEWSQGEVRHNFHLNQRVNAQVSTLWMNPVFPIKGQTRTAIGHLRVMYVVGQLVKLEVMLLKRAGAKNEGYASAAAGQILGLWDTLDILDDDAQLGIRDALTAIEELFEVIEGPPRREDEQKIKAAAEKVAAAARAFEAAHDGSKLKAIDEYLPKKSKGDVYRP